MWSKCAADFVVKAGTETKILHTQKQEEQRSISRSISSSSTSSSSSGNYSYGSLIGEQPNSMGSKSGDNSSNNDQAYEAPLISPFSPPRYLVVPSRFQTTKLPTPIDRSLADSFWKLTQGLRLAIGTFLRGSKHRFFLNFCRVKISIFGCSCPKEKISDPENL